MKLDILGATKPGTPPTTPGPNNRRPANRLTPSSDKTSAKRVRDAGTATLQRPHDATFDTVPLSQTVTPIDGGIFLRTTSEPRKEESDILDYFLRGARVAFSVFDSRAYGGLGPRGWFDSHEHLQHPVPGFPTAKEIVLHVVCGPSRIDLYKACIEAHRWFEASLFNHTMGVKATSGDSRTFRTMHGVKLKRMPVAMTHKGAFCSRPSPLRTTARTHSADFILLYPKNKKRGGLANLIRVDKSTREVALRYLGGVKLVLRGPHLLKAITPYDALDYFLQGHAVECSVEDAESNRSCRCLLLPQFGKEHAHPDIPLAWDYRLIPKSGPATPKLTGVLATALASLDAAVYLRTRVTLWGLSISQVPDSLLQAFPPRASI